jgi:hypothetical protein
MSGSIKARVEDRPSTPVVAAVKPGGEVPVDADDLEIDAAGIQLLIDFFLQLKKWDKLQSTRAAFTAPEFVKEIAA